MPTHTHKIVLASGNSKKLQELQQMLAGKQVECLPQSHFGFADAVEDGLSFVENAIIKARHASRHTGLPAIADDSGLEVDALAGAPGIHSARYALRDRHNISSQANSDDADNNALLLQRLEGIPEAGRTARFQCAIVLMRYPEDPMPLVCQGTWEGRILTHPVGSNGFGYDPLFYVPTHNCSSAELTPEVKNTLSHRGQALQLLLERWPARLGKLGVEHS
jgi:XTP/dITP diphosphohydrolase